MDVFQHHRGLRHAERGRRLVEDQHLGAEIDRAGDRHALALAARERAHRLMGIAHVDADLHLLPRDLVAMVEIDVAERPEPLRRLAAHEEVARDRHERDHREVLEDRGDARIERVAGRREGDVVPSTRTRRSSADAPDRVLMRVDLPAPLSPRRHITSPRSTVIETPESAITEPKCLTTLRTSMRAFVAMISAPRHFAADEVVEQHRQQQHGAEEDLEPVAVEARVGEADRDHAEDDGAEETPIAEP